MGHLVHLFCYCKYIWKVSILASYIVFDELHYFFANLHSIAAFPIWEYYKNIILGPQCTLEEIEAYTKLFKEFHDVFSWSYLEMLGLDPTIFEHHIDTWPDANIFHQKLRPINPSIQEVVKDKID